MPTYEYRCRACGHGFDIVQAFADDTLTICPSCGGELRKIFAAPTITFKGSGFYATDNRKGGKGGKGEGDSNSEGSKDSKDGKDGKDGKDRKDRKDSKDSKDPKGSGSSKASTSSGSSDSKSSEKKGDTPSAPRRDSPAT